MDFVSSSVLLLVTWWIVFFMALPFGGQASPQPEQGHDTGAPKITYLKPKLIATTAITIGIWFFVDHLISINFIDFREMGRRM